MEYDWKAHRALHNLHERLIQLEGKVGQLSDRIAELEESVGTLKTDLEGTFTAITNEIAKLEGEIADPSKLANLKSLVDGLDQQVKGFSPAPAPAPSPTPEPSPAPSPEPAPSPSPEQPAAPTQPVYLFVGEGTPDTTTWPVAPFVTDEATPRALYYFTGDQPGSTTANGVGQQGWMVWTGAVKPQA